ncbi:Periplasmic nitrate reductase [Mycobacterium innocens]|uniref:Periplasmic nitrate reductase n=1 Tax=Mycobacterium innocens TaxID=2341083 RepID=A0A498PS86_9MYCO|nr:Periplasmic nitrate reductase [Mycobacterium innocens]
MVTPDRIAQPWGTRTPYGAGQDWPQRIDQYLADGLNPESVDQWVQSAAVLPLNGDGLDIAVKDGRIVGVRGRAVDRVNHGRLDPKDLFGWQANASPDRLTTPLIRRDGQLRPCDWDTAMDAIVQHSRELLDKQGPSAIGFYTSGQLFLEEYYIQAIVAHGAIGTNHVDGNTRLCTATAAEALKEIFGCDGQPGSYTDVDHADVIALFGHNLAETQTVLWARMLDRLAGDTPPANVCVDPRLTPVARQATVHLAPLPGTNVALMNGLLHEIIAHDWSTATTSTRTPSVSTSCATGWRSSPHRALPRSAASTPTTSAARQGFSAPPSDCCPPCCRASTSPIKPPRQPSRSTTFTWCSACSVNRAAASCR